MSHIGKFSLRLEPATLEVKGKCANHFATEAPIEVCFDLVLKFLTKKLPGARAQRNRQIRKEVACLRRKINLQQRESISEPSGKACLVLSVAWISV